jgi:flagellar biosynthesis protein FliQ
MERHAAVDEQVADKPGRFKVAHLMIICAAILWALAVGVVLSLVRALL